MTENEDIIFNADEAAAYLKLGVFTLKKYLRLGIIKGSRIGDLTTKENRYRWRIRKSDLDAYLESNSNV